MVINMAIPVFFSITSLGPFVALVIKFLVGTLIARAITALGIALITYSALTSIGQMVSTHFLTLMSSGSSGTVVQLAMALGLHSAANIIFSAYIGSLAIRAAMGATKRLVFGHSSD